MIKVAMFAPPYDGGTYTAALRLREGLARKGFDVRCIGVKEDGAEGGFARRELEPGVEAWQVGPSLPQSTRWVIDELLKEDYRIAVTLTLEHLLTCNLPRYLPREVVSIIRVPMMSRAVYVRTRKLEPYADRVIAVSDRVGGDLVQRFGLPPEKICTVFNGVDLERFPPRAAGPRGAGPTRALYVGRLSDLDKGVLLLPKIMDEVRRQTSDLIMDVVGSGGDGPRLKAQVNALGLANTLRLLGSRPLHEIPAMLRDYDCIVMPSRMEACSWSLLEGMAAGCVPVVHDIWGSLGTIVEDGVSGFTVPVGDIKRFADRLVQLGRDAAMRWRMGQAARLRIQSRFTLAHMAEGYARVFHEALSAAPERKAPESLDRYAVPSVLRRTWRSHLPRPVKVLARKWMVRLGMPA